MSRIFGISSLKVSSAFPSLEFCYRVPTPKVSMLRRGCFVKSLKPYVAETNANRYYFRKLLNSNSKPL